MASVIIDSGQFPLLRNIDRKHQPNRSKVVGAWIHKFTYDIPDGLNNLADVIEDIYAFKMWEDYYMDTPQKFFEYIGLSDLNLEDPARLIATLRGNHGEDAKKKVLSEIKPYQMRRAQVQELKSQDPKLTQQEIADQVGVSRGRVTQILLEKTEYSEKTNNPKREIKQLRISSYTTEVRNVW